MLFDCLFGHCQCFCCSYLLRCFVPNFCCIYGEALRELIIDACGLKRFKIAKQYFDKNIYLSKYISLSSCQNGSCLMWRVPKAENIVILSWHFLFHKIFLKNDDKMIFFNFFSHQRNISPLTFFANCWVCQANRSRRGSESDLNWTVAKKADKNKKRE